MFKYMYHLGFARGTGYIQQATWPSAPGEPVDSVEDQRSGAHRSLVQVHDRKLEFHWKVKSLIWKPKKLE